MARLQEPEEVRTKRTSFKKEPTSWQVRQSRGLPNDPQARHKMKLEEKKLELQTQDKELNRQLKIQQAQEKSAAASRKEQAAERSKEEATWQKWSSDLKKQQEKDNIQQFQNFLIQNYATQDDKGRTILPLDVQKRAAGYTMMARTDGAGAIKKFKEDYIQEGSVKQQYQQLLPQIIKDREKALGKALDPKEIESLSQLSPEDMKQVVGGWQQKQAAVKAQKDAEIGMASKELEKPQRREEIIGGKERYTGEQFRGPSGSAFGNLPVRNDLSFNEATQAYDDVVDRAVSTMGGGGLATAAGAYMKYMPGARDLIDPNTPVRYGLRKAGEFIQGPVAEAAKGTWENIKSGEGTHPTGIDVLPGGAVEEGVQKQFNEGLNTAGGAIAGAAKYAMENQHPTGVDVLPTAEPALGVPPQPTTPPAAATPQPAQPVPGTSDTLAAGVTQPTNLFSGLADKVKGLFTASPEEMDRRKNIWEGMAEDARRSGVPLNGVFQAPKDYVRQAEPIGPDNLPKFNEEEKTSFPKVM